MKREQVKPGMQVAVNNLPAGTIYKVEEVSGFDARLSYRSGSWKKVSGGWLDVSCLRKPTKKQLANNEKRILQASNRQLNKILFGI